MRFPDIEKVVQTAIATLRRFPATLTSALVACVLAMVLIDMSGDEEPIVRALLAAILGIASMFAVESASERSGRGRWRWPAVGAVALALVAFGMFSGGWSETHLFERFFQLLLFSHLVAAFAAFVGTREENGFWQFNRALFLQFAVSTLYAGVLFAGLAVALRSIDALFGVDISGETYGRLWIFMALAVHPWMFLGGVPREISALEQERSYPPALKVFAQFILVPLVTVYLAILTAYLVRVVATQEWPSGWIGWLVSSVSAVGTLALLLVHPVREDEGNDWVRGYARWFWIALMPSIVMLYFAIGKRISQYGFTERRYYLLVLAVWISVVAVWFAFTRSKRIRFIPVSLAIVAALTFFGPWGAYAVSERSQVGRLTDLMTDAGAQSFPVAAGTVLTSEPEAARQVSDILRYLYGTHSTEVVRQVVEVPATADSLGNQPGRGNAGYLAQTTAESIGMRYFEPWESLNDRFVNLNVGGEVWPAPTELYEYTFRVYLAPQNSTTWEMDGHSVEVVLDSVNTAINISVDGSQALTVPLEALLTRLIEDGGAQVSSQPEQLVLTAISDRLRARVHVRHLGARRSREGYRVQNGEADVFLTLLEAPPDGDAPSG